MNNKPLVSIITPCFNGASFIDRFFSCIIAQTWDSIELIFIDDGSTDGTYEKALSYREKLEARGYSFICLTQENAGQAAAINRGLKLFHGDFLTWPDSDDLLPLDAIEKEAKCLMENPEIGIVFSKTMIVKEGALDEAIRYYEKNIKGRGNVFDDVIFHFARSGYMFRTSMFLDVNPDRIIYAPRGGQNWQMLLPTAYKYDAYYIDEPLYIYVVRDDSHSHADGSMEKADRNTLGYVDILEHVLSDVLPDDKYGEYIGRVHAKYDRDYLYNAYRYGSRREYNARLREYKKNYPVNKEIRVLTAMKNCAPLKWLYGKYRYMKEGRG